VGRPKGIVSRVDTPAPGLRAVRSCGATVTLSDGHDYLDLMNGKGCVTLGHHHPAVDGAMIDHLRANGAAATCWSDRHEQLAETILADCAIPGAALGFFSTGTDACRVAVQAARAFTGRRLVASAGYHGWGDQWGEGPELLEPNANGVVDFYFLPELLSDLLDRHRDRIALVILSPDHVHCRPETLAALMTLAREHGVPFCCDDVKQGYRSVAGSALPALTGMEADLYTFAKGLANGQRLSCVVGRPEIMRAARHLTYTAYFDTLPVIAALATLDHMAREDGYRRLVACGGALAGRLREAAAASGLPVAIYGDGPMLQLVGGTDELDQAMYAACAAQRLLLYEGDNQSVSLATEQVIDDISERFAAALAVLQPRFAALHGTAVSPERQFAAAFQMMDGATDAVPARDALTWITRMRA